MVVNSQIVETMITGIRNAIFLKVNITMTKINEHPEINVHDDDFSSLYSN